jgi:hypothetical protein
MRHDWERLADTAEKVCRHGWWPMRVCKNCGAVQKHEDEQLWGRIVARHWRPIVGRCKSKKQHNEDKVTA